MELAKAFGKSKKDVLFKYGFKHSKKYEADFKSEADLLCKYFSLVEIVVFTSRVTFCLSLKVDSNTWR